MSKQPTSSYRILPCDDASETSCPSCGEQGLAYLPLPAGFTIMTRLSAAYAKCLGEHPKEVARHLRERVADRYDLSGQAHSMSAGELCHRCIKAFAGAQNIGMPSPFE
jgi:hypothetical protein